MTIKNSSTKKIKREKQTIEAMISIYCKGNHQKRNKLCSNCERLLTYANGRLDNCPFQNNKPACNYCKVHCYSKIMQQEIKDAMRYAGPRMFFHHPILSIWHIVDTLRKVPKLGDSVNK